MNGISGWLWVAVMHRLDDILSAAIVGGVTLIVGVTALVSDAVAVAFITQAGALLAATVAAILSFRGHRTSQQTKALAEDTRHQVAVNGHSSTKPTLPDRIIDLAAQVAQVQEHQAAQNEKLGAIESSFADHRILGEEFAKQVRADVRAVNRKIDRFHGEESGQ